MLPTVMPWSAGGSAAVRVAADALVRRRLVRAQDAGDEVHRVLAGGDAVPQQPLGGGEPDGRLLARSSPS